MAYFLGIDLGTTYTAAAVRRDGHTEIAALSDRSPMVPSVLFLTDDDTVLVGDIANRRGLAEPERVAREFKRRFGDSAPLILGGVPYGADLLTARLLRWVVDRVTEREGAPPERMALTHPANWGSYKLDLLHQAVRRADLDGVGECETISEPTAAATWYATQDRIEPGQAVVVYDLGGGTFDAAVLRRTEGGFEMLGQPEGIDRLGGIDFDAAVFAHVTGVLGASWDDLDPDLPAARAAVANLRRECVEAKEALSADNNVTIPVVLPGVHTEVRLTRSELETMVRPAVTETVAVLRRALRGAGVEPGDVHRVLLVDGSSRIPLASQIVSTELGRPTAVDAHPKNAVALGAAVAAAEAAVTTTSTMRAVLPTPAAPSDAETTERPAATAQSGGHAGSPAPPPARPPGPPASPPSATPGSAEPTPVPAGAPETARSAPAPTAAPSTARSAPPPTGGPLLTPAVPPTATPATERIAATAHNPAAAPPRPSGPQPDPRPPVRIPAPAATPSAAIRPASPGTHRPGTRPPGADRSGAGTPGPAPRASAAHPGAGARRRGPRRGFGRRIFAVLLALVAIAGAATAAIVLREREGAGTGSTGSSATTEGAGPETDDDVDLDRDDDGRIDHPGPPPGHVEPEAALVAPEVAAFTNGNHEGFERVSISFTGDLPPAVELRPDPVNGIIRVWFPETSPTGTTDTTRDFAIFDNSDNGLTALLMIDETGQAWVDIHSRQPVVAQVFRIVTPAGTPVVAVDLEPGDGPWG